MPRKKKNLDDEIRIYKCTCCGAETDAPAGKFYKITYSKLWVHNDNYAPVCKVCVMKKFNEDARRFDTRTALIIACHYLDIPFVNSVYESLKQKKNDDFTVGDYSRIVCSGVQYSNKTFATSLTDGELTKSMNQVKEEREVKWEDEDLRNKKFVIEQYGYDPFCDDSYDEADRKLLFNMLAGYVDDDEDSAHKRISALNLVTTILQRTKIDRLINNELLCSAPSADLKTFTEAKDKLDRNINSIANDNGFSAKSQGRAAQKGNSLTRIMREMIDADFADCKVNAFDAKMKGVYKKMADISNKNLIDQLNFQSDDYARMVAQQRELLQKNDEKLMSAEEENRKLRLMVRQLGGEKLLGVLGNSNFGKKATKQSASGKTDGNENQPAPSADEAGDL